MQFLLFCLFLFWGAVFFYQHGSHYLQHIIYYFVCKRMRSLTKSMTKKCNKKKLKKSITKKTDCFYLVSEFSDNMKVRCNSEYLSANQQIHLG